MVFLVVSVQKINLGLRVEIYGKVLICLVLEIPYQEN